MRTTNVLLGSIIDFFNTEVGLFGWAWLVWWHILAAGLFLLLVTLLIIILCATRKKRRSKKAVKNNLPEKYDSTPDKYEPMVDYTQKKEEDHVTSAAIYDEPINQKPEYVPVQPTYNTINEPPAPQVNNDTIAASQPAPKPVAAPLPKDDTSVLPSKGGKYIVAKNRAGKYVFTLHANNGAVLYESNGYTSVMGAKTGMETFKKYIKDADFDGKPTDSGNYVYCVKRGNGSYTSRPYESEGKAKAAFMSLKRFHETSSVIITEKAK